MKKILPWFAWFILGFSPFAVAAEPPSAPPSDAVLIDHTKVAAAFAQGMPMMVNTSYKIQAGRRVMAGEAELHDHDTDILYILEGTATFVTGGKVVEPRVTASGETRGKSVEGGVKRQLVKGDIIVIPNGVPHWFSEVGGTFLYFVVKVTK